MFLDLIILSQGIFSKHKTGLNSLQELWLASNDQTYVHTYVQHAQTFRKYRQCTLCEQLAMCCGCFATLAFLIIFPSFDALNRSKVDNL